MWKQRDLYLAIACGMALTGFVNLILKNMLGSLLCSLIGALSLVRYFYLTKKQRGYYIPKLW